MKKRDLVNDVADRMKVPRYQAEAYVTAMMYCIKEALKEGDDVILSGIGVLGSKFYESHKRRIPFLGHELRELPAKRRLTIRTHDTCSYALTQALDAGKPGVKP